MVSSNGPKSALQVRPNTGLPQSFIQDDMIICTGEDPDELIHAMRAVLPGKRPRVHRYRCYRAWKYQGFTVIISGIGTGCLEPLLWEILDHKSLGDRVAKRLVMIGSAGYKGDSSNCGKVYLVEGAYPVGSAVQLEEKDIPVLPNFQGLEQIKLEIPHRYELSSDYYYAHTDNPADERKRLAQLHNPRLRESIEKFWQQDMLISMEVASFYSLAGDYGPPGTQYLALRGVANAADAFETQGDYSLQVLTDAFRQAVSLLVK
jgi:purine-nucleoside phosphorylase